MKPVLVTVKSVQRDINGEDTTVELVSTGMYGERNGVYYIRYEESSTTGLDGVKTTIKVHPDSIILLRTGSVSMRHQYVRGEERDTVYETPFGPIEMSLTTHELDVHMDESGGHVHLGYDIAVDGQAQFYNQLDIDVREE